MSRLLAFLALAAVASVVAATPTAAKEGVVARVLTPIPRNSEPGAKLKIVWTLSYVEAGIRHPFGAGAVFIRLFGADGARSPRVYASEFKRGRYRALVDVPRGGVRRVVIGLMGRSCGWPSGCRPSPAIFEIVGQPLR